MSAIKFKVLPHTNQQYKEGLGQTIDRSFLPETVCTEDVGRSSRISLFWNRIFREHMPDSFRYSVLRLRTRSFEIYRFTYCSLRRQNIRVNNQLHYLCMMLASTM